MSSSQTRRSMSIQRSAGTAHFLYRCYDADGLLLYIGCSSDPARRLEQHRHSANKTSRLIQAHATAFEVDADVYPTRDAGRDAELVAIHAEQPLFNVQHRCVPSSFAARQVEDYEAGRPVRHWPFAPLPSARVRSASRAT